jgi:hypothetical protein
MWVVFFGIFLLGIATSFYFSFGLPYVDDNSDRDDSPFFLSLVSSATCRFFRQIAPLDRYAIYLQMAGWQTHCLANFKIVLVHQKFSNMFEI